MVARKKKPHGDMIYSKNKSHLIDICAQRAMFLPFVIYLLTAIETLLLTFFNTMNSNQIFLIIFWLFGYSTNKSFQTEQEYRSSDLDNIKCDSIVCASIVSKCILTSDCKCDNIHSNRTCSENCSKCLDYLYQDCCLCFGKYQSIRFLSLCQFFFILSL